MTLTIAATAALGQETVAAPSAPSEEVSVDISPVEAWQQDPTIRFDAADVSIDDFKWIARPIVVFAESEFDPAYREQIDLLDDRSWELARRDVVVITDTDPAAMSDARQRLRPRGFMMALLGKDGGVKLRKPFPSAVREIGRSIDKMPMRQQELRDRRDADG